MKKKSVSIKDVAKLAGVSISTVSRVINSSSPVSEELKVRVYKAIEELHYEPNLLARSLRVGLTKLIGFVIPDITNPAFLTMVKGAEDYLRKKGYSFILSGADNDAGEELKLIKAMISKKVDGLIITCSGGCDPHLKELLKGAKNMVFLDRRCEKIDVPYVGVDNAGGIKQMVNYLIKTGHRSFAFINGDENTSTGKERYMGFIEALRENSIEDYQVLSGKFTYESGYSLVKKLKKLPDALVCGNDLIAFGAIDALENMGYSVPDDVSVTGFDDMFFSRYFKPSLTTVRQPIYDMGREAAKLLIGLLHERIKRKKEIILSTEIVVRQSTRDRTVENS
ncbi:MAG: LacI family DNA-binding transcriptional regulator [Candidatus Marinimicrobia bacterium]|nr:LacI family DNA-binding transcriptional regulator [Candidatus Neomarinimicrobiota bacterium]RKX40830.1 MAG: LacI family transcriptional regulator [Thermotogota bacterium]